MKKRELEIKMDLLRDVSGLVAMSKSVEEALSLVNKMRVGAMEEYSKANVEVDSRDEIALCPMPCSE